MIDRIRRNAKRLWKALTTDTITRDSYSVAVERKRDKVVLIVKADQFTLRLPMTDDKAWLVGGRLMDAAHAASGERAEEAS